MRFKSIALILLVCFFPAAVRAASEDGAIEQYRAYVTAVRAGKVEDIVKLVEPVPEDSKPLFDARMKQVIAVEAMKKEMIAQMGPPKADEEEWDMGGLPYDEVLKNLKPIKQNENLVVLTALDAKTKAQGVWGLMVRRDGKWVVSAGAFMDLEPTDAEPAPQFVQPDAAEREEKIKYADRTTKAADAVLQRLKKKEFKNPAEVRKAFSDEMQKAAKG